MNRFWDPIIRPILEVVRPRNVVEVGCDKGDHTRKLVTFCKQHEAVLHAVDPAPKFDVPALQEEYGRHFRFYQLTSLEALPLVGSMDVVLVDGDHNWYTVFHELKLINQQCEQLGHPFPLVFLHDVGWPYGRRDLYYIPESIPDPFRKPHKKLGLSPHSSELLATGGLNSGYENALAEGGARNGVLTAVEDFLSEACPELQFLSVPGLHGLGILYRSALTTEHADLAEFLAGFTLNSQVHTCIEEIERSRVKAEISRVEQSVRLRKQESELAEMQRRLNCEVTLGQVKSAELDDLHRRMEEYLPLIHQLEDSNATSTREVHELHSTWANELRRLEADVATREREIGRLQAHLENLEEKLTQQRLAWEGEEQRLQSDVAAREREIGHLQVLLHSVEEQLAQQRLSWDETRHRLESETSSQHQENQRQSETIAKLEAELSKERSVLRKRNEEFGRLEKRLREVTGQLNSVRRKLSQMHQTIQLLYASTSWRVTAPIRWIGSLLRRGRRTQHLSLVPLKDLSTEADGYRSTGRDPQFRFSFPSKHLPSGWVYLRYSAVAEEALLSPTVYVDSGQGYSETQAIRLPSHGTGRHGWVLRLPDRVKTIRFDPLEEQARFGLTRVFMRRIGKPELLLRLLWQRVRPVLAHPREWARLSGIAWSLLRRGNVGELKRRLLAGAALGNPGARRPVAPVLKGKGSAVQVAPWHFVPPQPVDPYQAWLGANAWTDRSLKHLTTRLATARSAPEISVILPVVGTEVGYLEAAVTSLLNQVYQNWNLYVAAPGEVLSELPASVGELVRADQRVRLVHGNEATLSALVNEAAGQATGELLAIMDPLDRLSPDALAEVVLSLNEHPEAEMLYADEDVVLPDGSYSNPLFKPGWSPELLLSWNYCGRFLVVSKRLFTSVEGLRGGTADASRFDFVLRTGEQASKVVHLPVVLNHRVQALGPASSPETAHQCLQVVQEALVRRGSSAEARQADWAVQTGRQIFTHDFPDHGPDVAVIIPVYSPTGLERLLASLATTSYQNYELVLVSHDSDLLTVQPISGVVRVRTLHVERPTGGEDNHSQLLNRAADKVTAQYVVFLQEGALICDPQWLSRLVGYAGLKGVGAVGARPIQRQADQRMTIVQNSASVSAHCLLTPRSVFSCLGGFDSTSFAKSHYVKDYCYRLVDSGYRCVSASGVEAMSEEHGELLRDPVAAAVFRTKYFDRPNPWESPYVTAAGQILPRKLVFGNPEPIRTMVFSHNLNATEGAPNSLFEVVVELKKRGVLDPVVYSPADGLLRRHYEESGIRVVVGHNPTKDGGDVKAFDKAVAKLTELMKSLQVELAYANTLQTYYGIIAAERLGLPAVWNPRESEPWESYFDFLSPEVRRQAYACFSYPYRVVYVAHATQANWGPLNSHYNATVIHNGLNLQRLEEQTQEWSRERARAELGLRDDEVMVFGAGTVTFRKGQEDLVLALQHLPAEVAARVRCFLVGARPNPYTKQVMEMVAALPPHLKERLTIMPETPAIAKYYAAADVFVCTSRMESFPRVILEAMACGLPIVSTPVFGIKEQVWDGVNGVFYEPGRPLELAQRLTPMILDEGLRKGMAERSRHVLGTLNNFHEMAGQYVTIFREAFLSKGSLLSREPLGSGTPQQAMDLSIMTISRSLANLDKLMTSIRTSRHRPELEILLAWNGQEDIEVVRNRYADLPLQVFQITPYNFARNNNGLFRHSTGACCLFVNDDIELDPDALRRAWDVLHQPGVGLVGANLRYPNGMIQHAGVMFRPDGRSYHRFKHELRYDDPAIAQTCSVPAITGAFMLMRSDDFARLLFNEDFRVCGEDLDLCLRFRKLIGKDIVYVADATAIHYEGVTRRTTGERLTPPEDLSKIIASWLDVQGGSSAVAPESVPKIRIVTEKPGWILHRMGAEIQNHIPNVRINEDWDDADIHYYINYGYFNRRPRKGLVVANFTHYDPDKLADKFAQVAHEVDHCIAISQQTVDDLKRVGIPDEKISLIIIGADTVFKPMMALGIVGRTYPGGRKGEHIVKALLENEAVMDGLQIVSTHEGWGVPVWKFDHMADFYRSIDYLLVPSLIEGGPVPFMEALACGTLSIAPPIGVIPMFPHIEYPTGDVAGLVEVIQKVKQDFVQSKSLHAKTMQPFNWESWADAHGAVFRMLIEKAGGRSGA